MRTNNYLSIEPSLSRTQSDNKKAHLASLKQKRDDWKTIEIDKFLFFISLRQKKVFCLLPNGNNRTTKSWMDCQATLCWWDDDDNVIFLTMGIFCTRSCLLNCVFFLLFLLQHVEIHLRLLRLYMPLLHKKKTKQKCTKISFRHFLYFAV